MGRQMRLALPWFETPDAEMVMVSGDGAGVGAGAARTVGRARWRQMVMKSCYP